MKKRILSIILSLVMLLSLLPVTAAAVETVTKLQGSGTAEDPYLIGTLAELNFMAYQINNQIAGYASAHYRLTADIGTSDNQFLNRISTVGGDKFTGCFDGAGHTVYLYIQEHESKPAGMFGFVGTGGVITNLITAGAVGGGTSCPCTGAICAHNEGGTIENCKNLVVVGSEKANAGGICGINDSTGKIINCVNAATQINTQYNRAESVGGIVGQNSGTVDSCRNSSAVYGGNYIGGICGLNYGTVMNCTNSGEVAGHYNATIGYAGGVCGSSTTAGSAKIVNCINHGNVKGKDYVGGLNGYSGNLKNSVNTGSVSWAYQTGSSMNGIAPYAIFAGSNCYCGAKPSGSDGSETLYVLAADKMKAKPATTDSLVDKLNGYKDGASYPSGWLTWCKKDDTTTYPYLPYHVSCSSYGGTITVANAATPAYNVADFFAEGDTVTVTVAESEGFVFTENSLKVNGASAGITDNQDGTYTFAMPAENVIVTAEFEKANLHIHKVNGADVEFQPWDKTNSLPGPDDLENGVGSFYLTEDVTLVSRWQIPAYGGPSPATINLCLNGHKLDLGGQYITVQGGGTLNLYDCDTTTVYNGYIDGSTYLWTADASNAHNGQDDEYDIIGGLITNGYVSATKGPGQTTGGSLTMNGGTIAGTSHNPQGGGVYVTSSSFTMNGGAIVGNKTSGMGGGIFVSGTGSSFTMNGGVISYNTAPSGGGGVYVNLDSGGSNCTFTMNDGVISNNQATDSWYGSGGGVLVKANCTFTMNGGTISGNTATYTGGGVSSVGTFTMKDGLISGNTSTLSGGGVFTSGSGAAFTMTGGTVTDNSAGENGGGVFVGSPAGARSTSDFGGKARIIGNTVNGEANNCYFENDYSCNSLGYSTGKPVPENGMLIGVSKSETGLFATLAPERSDRFFFSDDASRYVSYDVNHYLRLDLLPAKSIRFTLADNGVVYAEPQAAAANTEITLTVVPDEGYELEENGLKVNGSTDGITDNGDDTYTFTMPNENVTVTASFVESGPKIKVVKAKDGGNEVANPVYGTAITTAAQLFDVSVLNFPVGTTPELTLQWKKVSGQTVTWDGSAPDGVVLDTDGKVKTSANTPAGEYVFRITNGLADDADGFVSSGEITLTVEKAASTITTPPTAAAITYGKTLNASKLSNGVGSVAGTFAWSDTTIAPAVSDSGTTEYEVVFTPTDADNYSTATCKVTLTVNKDTPSITAWPTLPTSITYGDFETFGDITLTGGTVEGGVTGTFAWADSIKDTDATVASSGAKTDPFVFTPTDTDNYNTVTGGGSVTVTIGAANYADTYSRVASGNLRAKLNETVEITLPAIPSGASYGTVTNNNIALYTIDETGKESGSLTVKAAKDWDESTDGTGAKTFTVAVTPDGNHNGYDITVSITPTYKTEVTFAADAKPVNGGNAITYGTTYEVTAPTVSADGAPLTSQPDMTYTYYVSNGAGGWTALNPNNKPTNAGSYKVVIAVEDDNYEGSKEYTFTIAKADVAAPTVSDALTIDYANEMITLKTGYELSTTSGSGFGAADTAITFGTTYHIRKTEDANHNASAEGTYVPARPAAPAETAFTTTAETVENKKDGTFGGITETMEYSINGAAWTSGPAALTGLSGETVKVRYKATSTAFKGEEYSYTFTPSTEKLTVTMGESSAQVAYDSLVSKPEDPEKSGFTFGGWYSDEDCTQAWNFGVDTVTDNMTLYPKWIKNAEQKAVISGTVKENGGSAVSGATVELYLGTVKVAATVTDGSGIYSFDNVENGVYNIVVKKDGKTKTEMVTVDTADTFTKDVELPAKDVSSVVEVEDTQISKAKSDASKTVVGGLDEIAKDTAVGGGEKVTIKLTVESKPENKDDPAQTEIRNVPEAKGKTVEFVDLKLTKQVNTGDPTDIGGSNTQLLTVVIPFDFNGVDVSSVMILRKHGAGNAEKLTKNPETNEEGFTVDRQAGTITVYAKQFSTYAIGYAEESSGDVTTYAITGANIENGKLTIGTKYACEGQNVKITVTPDDGYALDQLAVLDKSGKELELTKVNDTTYSFKMPSGKVTVSATFKEVKTVCPQDETCVYAKFTDADTKEWYHDGVHFCVEKGIMNGVETNLFDPEGTLSRAMIVTMLWRMEGEPVVDYAMTFQDVEDGEWYTEAIRWAQSTKVVEGYDADAFGPNDDVTREQLAAILYRYAQLKGEGFKGAWMFLLDFVDRENIASWADEAVHWCYMKGIVHGKDGKVFDPQGNATRAEAASMVQRFCKAFQK